MNACSKLILGAVLLSATPSWAVYHSWSGKGQAGRLDDIGNWGIGSSTFTSDDFHDPAKTVPGSENQVGGLVTGTYTIGADTYFNRLVMDKTGQSVNFDLGDHTLYLVGLDNLALGATANGSNATYTVTSGTLCIPLQHNGVATLDNQAYAGLPRTANSGDRELHDASLLAKGPSAVLDLKKATLDWGTNNVIGAVDGGTLMAYTREMNVAQKSRGNRFYLARGGKLKNPYANPTKDQLCCNFTFSGTADGHRYEFADGGTQEGYERFAISGGTGFEVRFTGAQTDVTFDTTNASAVLTMTGTRNLLSVLDGAKLRVTNSLAAGGNRARIWLNGSGNVIRASGAGSLAQFFASGNLIGQFASSDHLVHATNYGEIQMAGTNLGRGGDAKNGKSAANNRLLVDDHGVFRDRDTLYVGYGDAFTASSNRVDVRSGGTVHANRLFAGYQTNAVENVVDIGSNGTVNVAVDLVNGYFGSRNLLDVHDGGCLNVGSGLYVGYRDASTNRVVIRDGARVAVGGYLTVGANHADAKTRGNTVEILSGSDVSAGNFVVYCSNACVKVENARVCTTNEDAKAAGVQIPWYNERDWDAHLILSGTNPVVRSASRAASATGNYALGIRRGALVTFVIPKGGYVEPPLQAPNGRIGLFDDDNGHVPDFRFDLSDLPDGLTEAVLTASKELFVKPVVLERLQTRLREAVTARFGAGTSCRVSTADGRLSVRIGSRGLCVIVR